MELVLLSLCAGTLGGFLYSHLFVYQWKRTADTVRTADTSPEEAIASSVFTKPMALRYLLGLGFFLIVILTNRPSIVPVSIGFILSFLVSSFIQARHIS